jgi:hypothetical protein
MTKRLVLVMGTVLVVLGCASVAVGATKPAKHKLTDTMALRVLTSSATGATFTGTILDKANGAGAVVVKATGSQSASVNKVSGTGFFKNGTISVKGSVTTAPRADGTGVDFSGSVKAVKGTGVFKGVTGTLKLVGSSTSQDPTYQTYKVAGSLTY